MSRLLDYKQLVIRGKVLNLNKDGLGKFLDVPRPISLVRNVVREAYTVQFQFMCDIRNLPWQLRERKKALLKEAATELCLYRPTYHIPMSFFSSLPPNIDPDWALSQCIEGLWDHIIETHEPFSDWFLLSEKSFPINFPLVESQLEIELELVTESRVKVSFDFDTPSFKKLNPKL